MFLLPCCAVQSGAEASKKVDPQSPVLLNGLPQKPGDEKAAAAKAAAKRLARREEIEEKGLNIGIGVQVPEAKSPSQQDRGPNLGIANYAGPPATSGQGSQDPYNGGAQQNDNDGGAKLNGRDELMPFKKTNSRKNLRVNTKDGLGLAAGRSRSLNLEKRKSIDCMEKYLNTSEGAQDQRDAASRPGLGAAMRGGQPVTKDNAAAGLSVVRGPDWKWKNEDGGNGQVGTILTVDVKKQTIVVAWHSTSHVGQQYRCGKSFCGKSQCDLLVAPQVAEDDDGLGFGRRDSQFMFSKKTQTIIIFDWDDTLFPTNYVRDDLELDHSCPMKDQPFDAQDKAEITQNLARCEQNVIDLINSANSLGKVILVTLARSPWVTQSCDNFYPKAGALIRQLKIPVVYAQTGHQVDYNKMNMMTNNEIERYWSGIKGKAIANEVKRFYSQYEGQSWKNIISIGDSDFERLGTQAATAEYMKQTGLGGAESEVDGHVFKVRTKTFKLVDEPTIEELTVEVAMLKKWVPLMVDLDKSFDVNLDTLADDGIMHRIQATLEGA